MAPRMLVAHASKHGSTAEIAEAIADELRRCGLGADCRPADEVGDLDGYDAVVLGSAVYMRRWRRAARRFVRRHRRTLGSIPFWAFSSGYVGKERAPKWEEPPRTIARLEALGVREHVVFGGRVPQDPSNVVEKAMLRDTPPEIADQRDFDAVRAWADRIAASVAAEREHAVPA